MGHAPIVTVIVSWQNSFLQAATISLLLLLGFLPLSL
jgi:hypothetical protein